MNKEHFRYIIDKYNLMYYSCTNDMFRPTFIGNLHYRIVDYNCKAIYNDHLLLFAWLPSEEMAYQIIEDIHKSAVLFA